MVTRLLLIVLYLGLLSTLSERYDDPALDGTTSHDRYDERGLSLGPLKEKRAEEVTREKCMRKSKSTESKS
jgi:hypothetical protein